MNRRLLGMVCLLVWLGGCAPSDPAPKQQPQAAAPSLAVAASDVLPVQACTECHAAIVETYLQHGMSQSVGPVETPPIGTVVNSRTGQRYELGVDEEGGWLRGTTPDGGTRSQRLVGRIGAGNFDTSWVGEEVDPFSSFRTGRLFFAPVETVTGRGLELSPFELEPPSAGLDMALTEGCLTCHTDTNLAELPGAATSPDGQAIYPAHALGSTAFDRISPITCEGCHGEARAHLTIMSGLPDEGDPGLGFLPIRDRTPGAQRDVCARCHLQGEARFEFVTGRPQPDLPLAGQIPVLVSVHSNDDFRFVGQVERLALSACFQQAPEMTCTTCHDPHTGVVEQGPDRFEAACLSCHENATAQHTTLTVTAVTGEPARTPNGCLDCHVRRSQPFDLPHIRTTDHFIRRTIPRPKTDTSYRFYADPSGPLDVFDDGRLADVLATPAGQRWRDGMLAMGLVTMRRVEEAIPLFALFPPPGTEAALQATAPVELIPLETQASFHHTRGLALLSSGQPEEALAAFTDALTLDPTYASARIERARLLVLLGDMKGSLADTDIILAAHPNAESPWDIRTAMALRSGIPAMAVSALEVSTQLWGSNATAWLQLGELYRQLGQQEQARDAFSRARALQPSLSGLPPAMNQ